MVHYLAEGQLSLQKLIADLASGTREGFDRLTRHAEETERRFQQLEAKFQQTDQRFNETDERIRNLVSAM